MGCEGMWSGLAGGVGCAFVGSGCSLLCLGAAGAMLKGSVARPTVCW